MAQAEVQALRLEVDEAKGNDKASSLLAEYREKITRLEAEPARAPAACEGPAEESAKKLKEAANEADDLRRVRDRLEEDLAAARVRAASLAKQLEEGAAREKERGEEGKEGKEENGEKEEKEDKEEVEKLKEEKERQAEEIQTLRKVQFAQREEMEALQEKFNRTQEDAKIAKEPLEENSPKLVEEVTEALKAKFELERRSAQIEAELQAVKKEKEVEQILSMMKDQIQIREKEGNAYKQALVRSDEGHKKELRLLSTALYDLGFRFHQLRAFTAQVQHENEALERKMMPPMDFPETLPSVISQMRREGAH
eukprot:GHVT01002295.1.p1 GENE.GHVT01002295.1~~GHVT01002295.1.p1  ORF type:complete len:311 (+),score=111.36 GHVT01002295.1:300-1232(+)